MAVDHVGAVLVAVGVGRHGWVVACGLSGDEWW